MMEQSTNWQPLVDALAKFVDGLAVWISGTTGNMLLVLLFIVLLWGRSRTASWLEALGWNGIVNAISSIWSSRGVTVNTTKEANFNVPLLASPSEHSTELARRLDMAGDNGTSINNSSKPDIVN